MGPIPENIYHKTSISGLRRGLRDHPAAERAGLPIRSKTIRQAGHFQGESIDADSCGFGD